MPETLADFAGNWTLSHTARSGRETLAATARVQGPTLIIEVPGFTSKGLTIELTASDGGFKGSFKLGSGGTGTVELNIQEAGRKLAGNPRGFAHRERWLLTRC